MKRLRNISLALALCLGLLLMGTGCKQGGGGPDDGLLGEYNAAVEYLNQAGSMVEQNAARYAEYFGLEDELALSAEGSYLPNLSFTAENFATLDLSLEAYEKAAKDESLKAALQAQDACVRALIGKGDEIVAHCAEKAYEGDGGAALGALHGEFIAALRDYDAAAAATGEKLGVLENALNEQELQYALDNKLYIQHSMLKTSLAVDDALLALDSEDAGTAAAALQEAAAALEQFDGYITDSKQVEKEGYQSEPLQSLSQEAHRLLERLEGYIAGEEDAESVSRQYESFVGSYNSAIYYAG